MIHSQRGLQSRSPVYFQHPSFSVYGAGGSVRSLSATNLELMAPVSDGDEVTEYRSYTLPHTVRPRFSCVPSVIAESDGNGSNENMASSYPLHPTVSVSFVGNSSEVNITVPRRGRSISHIRISHSSDSENERRSRERSRGRPEHRIQQYPSAPLTYRGVRQHSRRHRSTYRRPASQPVNRYNLPVDMNTNPYINVFRDSEIGSRESAYGHTAHRSLSAGQAYRREPTHLAMGENQTYQDSRQQQTVQRRVTSNPPRACSRPRPPAVRLSSSSSVTCFQAQQTMSPGRQKYLSPERRPSTGNTAVSMNRRHAAESMEHARFSIDPDTHGFLDFGLSALPSATSQAAETCVPLNPTAVAKRQQEPERDDGEWRHGLCDPSGDCGICFTGLFCPCIAAGKTGHRIRLKAAHQDASNTYGLHSCNPTCMGFVLLCGCQGEFLF